MTRALVVLILLTPACKRTTVSGIPDARPSTTAAPPASGVLPATTPPAPPDAAPAPPTAKAALDAGPEPDADPDDLRSDERVTGAIVSIGSDGKPGATPGDTTVSLICVGPKPDEENHWRVRCDARLEARWSGPKGREQRAVAGDVPGMDWEQVAGNAGSLALDLLDVRDGNGALIVVTRQLKEGDMWTKATAEQTYYVVRGGALVKVLALDARNLDDKGPDDTEHSSDEETEVTAGHGKSNGLANILARTTRSKLGENGWEKGRPRLTTWAFDGQSYVVKR